MQQFMYNIRILTRLSLNMVSIIIFTILAVVAFADGKKVLAIYGHPGKSHHTFGEVILKKLAERGHEVTMVSPFPLKDPIPNYKDVYLDGFLEDSHSDVSLYLEMEKNDLLNVLGVLEVINHFTDRTFGHPAMQKLIHSGEKYDLIIMDWFCKDAELYYGNIFQAPIIFTSSFGTQSDVSHIINNDRPYSYVPAIGFAFTDEMDFFDRVGNTIASIFTDIIIYYNRLQQQRILNRHFENAPDTDDMVENVHLMFTNAHPVFETPRPYVPNVIPIGGIHVQEPKPLPKDLQDFLDKSDKGVVYFSLGSHMKTSALSTDTLNAILRAFSKIPQNVLLKWEKDEIPPLPDNVIVRKWMPQNSILAHPNVKVFITHGGLMSKIEAIYHGTPMIGVPFFGDQKTNVVHSVHEGIAVLLYLSELAEDTLFDAINKIVSNSSYSENIKKKSDFLKDQPMKPIDTAIYWAEFVMKHNGTKHLQNKGLRLNRFQNLLVDVVLFITAIVVSVVLILWKLCVLALPLLPEKKTQTASKKKVKKN